MIQLIRNACTVKYYAEGGMGGAPQNWRFDNAKIHKCRDVEQSMVRMNITADFTDPECPRQNGAVERSFAELKAKILRSLPDWQRAKGSRKALTFEEVENLIARHVNLHNFTRTGKRDTTRYLDWVSKGGSELAERAVPPIGELDFRVASTVKAKVQSGIVTVEKARLNGPCLTGLNGKSVIVRYIPGDSLDSAEVYQASGHMDFLGLVYNALNNSENARAVQASQHDIREQLRLAKSLLKDTSQVFERARRGSSRKKAKRATSPKVRPRKPSSQNESRECALTLLED